LWQAFGFAGGFVSFVAAHRSESIMASAKFTHFRFVEIG
jgi:hypothetical protein